LGENFISRKSAPKGRETTLSNERPLKKGKETKILEGVLAVHVKSR